MRICDMFCRVIDNYGDAGVSWRLAQMLAKEYDGRLNVGKCDVEENDGLAMRFGIRNVPTVLFIKDGEVVDKQVGAAPKSVFEDKLKAIL